MGFLDLVQQHHRIGLAAHRFGEHAATAVADVAGRGALELADGVGLLVLGEVDADQVAFAAVEGVGQGVGGLGLAHAGGAGQEEYADRLGRVAESGAIGLDALGDGAQGGLLAHHPLAHSLRQGTDGVGFVGEHLAHRDAGPAGDHRGHGTRVHLLGNQRVVLADGFEAGRQARQFGGQVVDATVQFLVGLGRVGAFAEGQQFAAGVEQFAHRFAFLVPAGLQLADGPAVIARLAFQGGDTRAVVEAGGLFPAQPLQFLFQRLLAVAQAFQRRRHVVLAEGDPRAGGVEHADRLVRQLAAGDVAVRQLHRIDDGRVHDLHAVMLFQLAGDAAQHLHGGGLVRLLDLDQLEAPGQRRVLLEVFLVFQPGGGRQGAQLAARQGRLEQVGGVAAAFCAAGADQRVRLVDEQDDRLRAVAHGVDHALEALLELALHAGAGLQQAEVEHPQDHLLQRRRHFAGGDAQGQALDHRGLADARRADQDRVVLPPAQEDVDALADLPVAPDYGVDAPGAGFGGEVLGVLVEQRVRGAFRLVAACRRAVRRGRLFAGGLDPLQQVGLQGLVGNPQ